MYVHQPNYQNDGWRVRSKHNIIKDEMWRIHFYQRLRDEVQV